ncbi:MULTISPECIES: 6,7-dimethyl-8-ribityllumazine synthase [Paracoccus]|jgi:6,7-dimethyl-8-ribityllumazine synthase|uniref:6,7-dimethyl-8-ribityllumazine synthase n=1 Tax=Paracoccus litorisediminis TaxID=2006130 RepID=A0A844HJ93_9RHOB|nr:MULTISPECIES: 6,7-dimethyl-8-ribityllumazine synthase [Paracoccus]MBD9527889.1 6,7-dimethyl-8-ribityllumazine synthase [Paracoccus sp. PAR01]MTH59946.1 6,7-dimethyl-8-ribityllumazine synthase [Paracoccus litorisediminis]
MAASIEHYQLPLPRIEGGVRLLIVVAPYYRQIADELVAGAKAVAASVGAAVDLVEVPGALEIPTAIGLAASRGLYDGYVALGCIIRGETTHYDTVCNDSSRGLTLLGLQGTCIGNGILTVENYDQAAVRAEHQGQNKGGGAAAAALHLIALKRGWEARPAGQAADLNRDVIRIAGELEGPRGA